MLTIADEPTIRWAILRRLDKEPGVTIVDIPVCPGDGCIRVGVEAVLYGTLDLKSRFDLPEEFELGHIHDEVDQIAEQYKAAKIDYWRRGRQVRGMVELTGTGLRGRWDRYGVRA